MTVRLSPREQRMLLIVIVFGAGILWMYSTFIVGPLLRRVSDLGQQVRAARDQLKSLEVATASEAALKQQHGELQETVASLRTLLPSEEELPQVIELLSDLASQSQVKIQSIFPQRPAAMDASKKAGSASLFYKDVTIQIDALAGYHQLGAFLSLVESGSKPMQVSSLRLATDAKEPKRLHIKLLVQSYFSTSGSVAIGGSTSL